MPPEVTDWLSQNQALPTWLQGVGTVIALALTVIVAGMDRGRRRRERRQERIRFVQMLAAAIDDASATMAGAEILSGRDLRRYLEDYRRVQGRLLDRILDIPLQLWPDASLFTPFTEMKNRVDTIALAIANHAGAHPGSGDAYKMAGLRQIQDCFQSARREIAPKSKRHAADRSTPTSPAAFYLPVDGEMSAFDEALDEGRDSGGLEFEDAADSGGGQSPMVVIPVPPPPPAPPEARLLVPIGARPSRWRGANRGKNVPSPLMTIPEEDLIRARVSRIP